MKILDLQFSDPAQLHDRTLLPRLCVATDSATILPRRPLFIPDTAPSMRLTISVACRVGRPGKSIPARFWDRHIDAFTLTARVSPVDIDPATGWASAVDFSYAPGEWISVSETPRMITGAIKSPQPYGTFEFNPYDFTGIAVERLSEHFTLKTGDIIILPEPIIECKAERDARVTATFAGTEVLAFNLK